jgi:hypothetical protein
MFSGHLYKNCSGRNIVVEMRGVLVFTVKVLGLHGYNSDRHIVVGILVTLLEEMVALPVVVVLETLEQVVVEVSPRAHFVS